MKPGKQFFLIKQGGRKIIKLLFVLFFVFLNILFTGVSEKLNAQQNPVKFSTLSSLEGLSSSLAYVIEQDKHGFIWIGTTDGLNVYNGYEFKTYRHSASDSNSLGHNYINSLHFDSKERMWIGTQGGVDLYDAKNDHFIHFRPELKAGSVSPNIFWIYEDQEGNIWTGTSDGVNIYNEETHEFEIHSFPEDLGISTQVLSFLQDKKGNYWAGTENGLYKWNPEKNSFKIYSHNETEGTGISGNKVHTLYEDSSGNIWAGTSGGLDRFNFATNTFTHFVHETGNPRSISHNRINSIAEGADGNLWIGTYEGGLNKFNSSSQSFERYTRDSKDSHSLADNAVKDVMVDEAGGLWVATFRGVSFAGQFQLQFGHLEHKEHDPYSLTDDYISALFKDSEGNIWSGNRYGISRLNPGQNNFTHYKHAPDDSTTIADGAILNICEDSEGNLWSVTHTGIVNKFDRKRNIFYRYHHNPADSGSIRRGSKFVYSTIDGNVWVKSDAGISRYNKGSDNFVHFGEPGAYGHGKINIIFEDSKRNFWVTNLNGIYWFDREKGTFTLKFKLPENLWPYHTTQIYEDSEKNIWIGSDYKGLIFYNSAEGSYKFYSENDAAPDIYVKGILEDKGGNLWLSSNNGLFRFDPDSLEYKEYGLFDGLKNKEFNLGACVKSDDGKLYFGGRNGISFFCPESIIKNPHPPKVIITDFQLFNKSVPIGENSPLKASVSETSYLELNHKQNVISFEFVGLNFNSTEKNQYAYKMENFEDDWNYSQTRRHATYTNLPPGKTYTFRVKASNNDGVWNEEGTSLQIYIKPPFWLTWWFYILVAVVAVITLYGLYRWRTRQLFLQHRTLERMVNERTEEVERQKDDLAAHATHLKTANNEIKLKNKKIRRQANKLKIIDQLKSQFLANISHEFRTPLTLILVPLEEMISASSVNPETREQLSVMDRNARRLLRLINQLLDLSKIENGKVPLELCRQNIVSFIRNVSSTFSSMAHKQETDFQFFSSKEEIVMAFDQDKLEKIISNLVSNALKFTPAGGSIHIGLAEQELTRSGDMEGEVIKEKYVQITVSDSGQGISAEHLPFIFDRFYQAGASLARKSDGTGIGLALTKELVELHGGRIQVKSEQGQGTCFTILLPVRETAPGIEYLPEVTKDYFELPAAQEEKEISPLVQESEKEDAPLLLIVEDNDDLRHQITRILSSHYRTTEAENGTEGWKKASELMPDLIISDIMMPGKDGLALCSQLKSDPATSHIPTILLSARIDSEEAGLSVGADDYITKPFNAKVLALKVRNLLETRKNFREAICKGLGVSPVKTSPEPGGLLNEEDTNFIEESTAVALNHLSDPDFKLETLYRELGMSRTLVYRKMKSLTGLGPNEFIRKIRLNKASQMLKEQNISVSEVMNLTGFNHRSYFVKCFKNEFGDLPSEHNGPPEAADFEEEIKNRHSTTGKHPSGKQKIRKD